MCVRAAARVCAKFFHPRLRSPDSQVVLCTRVNQQVDTSASHHTMARAREIRQLSRLNRWRFKLRLNQRATILARQFLLGIVEIKHHLFFSSVNFYSQFAGFKSLVRLKNGTPTHPESNSQINLFPYCLVYFIFNTYFYRHNFSTRKSLKGWEKSRIDHFYKARYLLRLMHESHLLKLKSLI